MMYFNEKTLLAIFSLAFLFLPFASADDASFLDFIAKGDVLAASDSKPSKEDLNAFDNQGRAPLHVSIESKQLTSVIFLLVHGADPTLPNSRGETAFDLAENTKDERLIRVLSAHGASLNTVESQLERRLHLAILRDDLVQVGIRLVKGEDVHTRDPERQWTPLHVATINGSHEQMDLFIALGAEVNARDSIGQMPLHFAAESGDVRALQTLIRADADVNAAIKNNGATALQMAVLSSSIEAVRLLLESDADPKGSDARGWSAIHIAALKDLDKIGKLLLENGADIHATTLQGYTAELIATASENRAILSVLKDNQ